MGEVIEFDFRGDGGVTDRYLAWPEPVEQADLIEQAKGIQAALMLASETAPAVTSERLIFNLDKCLGQISPLTDDLIEEIHSDAASIARELRKEII